MIKTTEMYLINFENKLTVMPLEITWEIQEKVLFTGREGKCLQGLLWYLLRNKEAIMLWNWAVPSTSQKDSLNRALKVKKQWLEQ